MTCAPGPPRKSASTVSPTLRTVRMKMTQRGSCPSDHHTLLSQNLLCGQTQDRRTLGAERQHVGPALGSARRGGTRASASGPSPGPADDGARPVCSLLSLPAVALPEVSHEPRCHGQRLLAHFIGPNNSGTCGGRGPFSFCYCCAHRF